ncbi:MAG TPA: hypothetical protein VK986_26070, partial [Tepidisphaeraceae bacterium]|nr:hypothetical protein [Tepidisphaeraceae bacterium]
MITLGGGSNAPSVVIDPHGIGVSEEDAAQPAAVAHVPQPAAAALPQPGSYAAPARPAYAPPQPYAPAAPAGFVEDDGDNVDLFAKPAAPTAYQAPTAYARPGYAAPGAVPGYAPPQPQADQWGAAAQTDAPKRKPKKRQGTNPAVMVAVVVMGLIALVIGIVIAVQKQNERNKPVVVTPPPPAKPTKPNSIFDDTGPRKAPAGGAAKSAAPITGTEPAVAKPPTTPKAPKPPASGGNDDVVTPEMNTKLSDPKYLPIDEARLIIEAGKPNIALYRLLELEREGNPFTKEIAEFKEKAYDRLWWLRVSDLMEERAKYQSEIASRKAQIKESADAGFKAGLQKEIDRYQDRSSRVDNDLQSLRYGGASLPKTMSEAELTPLRAQRDADEYEKWKKDVTTYIQRSRGERLPWRQTN